MSSPYHRAPTYPPAVSYQPSGSYQSSNPYQSSNDYQPAASASPTTPTHEKPSSSYRLSASAGEPPQRIANRPYESRSSRFILANYLLVVHFIVCILLAGTILIFLPGTLVNREVNGEIYGLGIQVTWLSVSDITTAITAALMVVRMATGGWSSMIAWRCVFLMMEQGDLDIRQLNSMVSWKLLRPSSLGDLIAGCFGKRRIKKRTTGNRWRNYVAIILLLMWPATLGAPLLSSAVDWLPYTWYVPDSQVNPTGQAAGVSMSAWTNYLEHTGARRDVVIRALGYVGMSTFGADPLTLDKCRHVEKEDTYPAGGVVNDVTYPCIEIGDIVWSNSDDDLNPVKDKLRNVETISITETPIFGYGQVGAMAMFDLHSWESNKTYLPKECQKQEKFDLAQMKTFTHIPDLRGSLLKSPVPEVAKTVEDTQNTVNEATGVNLAPITHGLGGILKKRDVDSDCGGNVKLPDLSEYDGHKEIVVLASRFANGNCGKVSDNFGIEPQGAKLFSLADETDAPCYIAGKVKVTAGVMRKAAGGQVISKNIVDIARKTPLDTDRWTDETLSLLPDVMNMIALTNMTTVRRWDNLEGYAKSVIQHAYSSTWDAMDQYLGPSNNDVSVRRPIALLQASVKVERVYTWLAFNLLFTISGIMQWVLQMKSKRPVVIDTAAVAILTDASQLLNDDKVGRELKWRNMSYVTKHDAFSSSQRSEDRILLKLERCGDGFAMNKKDM